MCAIDGDTPCMQDHATRATRAAILARRAKVTASIAKRQHEAGQHELAKATEYSARAARTALAALSKAVTT